MCDLLINKIEMTQERPLSITVYQDGLVLFEKDNGRLGNTKATVLPKHGRLVDADKVADNYLKYLMTCFPAMNMEKANELFKAVNEALKIAPTIVEATE